MVTKRQPGGGGGGGRIYDIPKYPISTTTFPPPGASLSASEINAVAQTVAQIQQQVAAGGDVLPIIFGTVRTGAMIAGVTVYAGNLIVLALWCEGEVDAVGSIFVNDLLAIGRATITAATKANPCVLTIPAHGLTEGQSIQISGVGGMTQLNGTSPTIHVIDVDNVSLNSVNSTAYSVYTSGGLAASANNSGITGTHYTGTASQPVDPTLKAAYGNAFADAMPGVCYSVFTIKPTANAGFPRLVAQIRGLKLPLTSGGTPTYTENAAFHIAALVENTSWGMARSVNWASVASVAAANDATIGTPAEAKRRLSLMLDTAQPGESWLQQLRDYAGCWIVPEGADYRLVADALPAAGSAKTVTAIAQAFQPNATVTAHGLTDGAIVLVAGVVGMVQLNGKISVVRVIDANTIKLLGVNSSAFTAYTLGGTVTKIETSLASFGATNIVKDSLSWALRGAADAPTIIETTYTDRTSVPWQEKPVTVADPRVASGSIPRRMSRVQRQGIYRASEAYRYGLERLNNAILCDMSVQFVAFDEALSLQVGDLVDVTHDIEFTSKVFRVQKIDPQSAGRWAVSALEWDPAVYSNVVVTTSSSDNTITPSPANPPSVAGLSLSEDVYQVATGFFGSRIRAVWTGPATNFPFVATYSIEVRQGGVLVDAGVVGPIAAASPPYFAFVSKQLPENLLYTVTVAIQSTIGAVGPVASATYTNNGKLTVPKDILSLTGFEIGGEVRLNWVGKAWDGGSIDLDWTATEIRYSVVGGSWATATLLDRVAAPSLRYSTKVVAPGTWRFWIKPLDSVRTSVYPFGQESDGSHIPSVDIAVTSDANAFVAIDFSYISPTLYNMTAHSLGDGSTFWVTDFAQTWNSLFTTTLNTYTNPLYTYHSAGNSGLVTESKDHGASVTGDWAATVSYSDLSGTAATYLELSANGPGANKTITGATNATPIVVTAVGHGYSNGQEISISGVVGNTAANGRFLISVLTVDTFQLQNLFSVNVAGNGAYTSGGIANAWTWVAYAGGNAKTSARYSRIRFFTTGTLKVNSLGNIKVNVIARREGGTVTTNASGPTIISFANKYNKAVSARASPGGTVAGSAVYDSVEVSQGRGINVGYNLKFTASGLHYVTVGNQNVHNFGNGSNAPFSIECWVNLSVAAGGVKGIISRATSISAGEYFFGFTSSSLGTVLFCRVIDNTFGTSILKSGSIPLSLGVWYHIALTYDGSAGNAGVNFYVDGILDTGAAGSGSITFMRLTTANLEIGRSLASGNYHDGRIDDVRLWNTQRTVAQIIANKDNVLTGAESGLVGYWKFDEGSGTTALDSTANAKNGTLTGTTGLPLYRPCNGMDIYRFNNAGTQIADITSWDFQGV